MFAPIYNAVNALLTRLTSTRAVKLDNLDATTSSRAPASTALSSATWTGTKAEYLDAAVTSRLADSTAATRFGSLDTAVANVWSAATRTLTATQSPIKSIQTGKIDTASLSSGSNDEYKYIDVTISSVTTTKCIILHQLWAGWGDSAGQALENARLGQHAARAYLTSATNLRAHTSYKPGLGAAAISGRWWVVEFN